VVTQAVRGEIVGREQELAELTAFLAAVEGPPAAFPVEGYPGIGKAILLRSGPEAGPG